MGSSDCFTVFLQSSLGLNFMVTVSSHDDISSLKKKAESQHLLLFPENGRIVAQAIKIMREGLMFHLSDSMPISCFIHGAAGVCSLFMDAVTLPPIPSPIPPETRLLPDQHKNSMHGIKILSPEQELISSCCKAGSLGEHNSTKQFAFGPSDKGKAKLDQIDCDSSRRTGSPNRKTLKMHGVTKHKLGPDRKITRLQTMGGEERDRGLSCEKCCSIEESGLESKKLEDQIARLNQIQCDKLMWRFLQEEVYWDNQTPDEEMLANWRVMKLMKALGVEIGGENLNLNLSEKERQESGINALFEFFSYNARAQGVTVQAKNHRGSIGALGPTGAVTKVQRQCKPPPKAAAAAFPSYSVAALRAKPERKSK